MLETSPVKSRNRLLAALSKGDLGLLLPNLHSMPMALRQDMEKPNKKIEHVYFMDVGLASVVAIQDEDRRVEVGVVGLEGMTGTAVVLGADRSPHSTYIQVAGSAQRIASDDLRAAMKTSESLRGLLLRYVQAFLVQTAHTAICNARTGIEDRLARWLLMAHDRLDGDEVPLTHEFLALMLGVRRAGVTEALHALIAENLIAISRGQIVVRDRKGLERRAGSSYGTPEAEWRRLIQ